MTQARRAARARAGLTQLMPGTASSIGRRQPPEPGRIDRRRRPLPGPADGASSAATPKRPWLPTTPAPERFRQYGGIPPYAETQSYVSKVLGFRRKLAPGTPDHAEHTGQSHEHPTRRAGPGCPRPPPSSGAPPGAPRRHLEMRTFTAPALPNNRARTANAEAPDRKEAPKRSTGHGDSRQDVPSPTAGLTRDRRPRGSADGLGERRERCPRSVPGVDHDGRRWRAERPGRRRPSDGSRGPRNHPRGHGSLLAATSTAVSQAASALPRGLRARPRAALGPCDRWRSRPAPPLRDSGAACQRPRRLPGDRPGTRPRSARRSRPRRAQLRPGRRPGRHPTGRRAHLRLGTGTGLDHDAGLDPDPRSLPQPRPQHRHGPRCRHRPRHRPRPRPRRPQPPPPGRQDRPRRPQVPPVCPRVQRPRWPHRGQRPRKAPPPAPRRRARAGRAHRRPAAKRPPRRARRKQNNRAERPVRAPRPLRPCLPPGRRQAGSRAIDSRPPRHACPRARLPRNRRGGATRRGQREPAAGGRRRHRTPGRRLLHDVTRARRDHSGERSAGRDGRSGEAGGAFASPVSASPTQAGVGLQQIIDSVRATIELAARQGRPRPGSPCSPKSSATSASTSARRPRACSRGSRPTPRGGPGADGGAGRSCASRSARSGSPCCAWRSAPRCTREAGET